MYSPPASPVECGSGRGPSKGCKEKKKASVSLCPIVGWGSSLSFILLADGVDWRVMQPCVVRHSGTKGFLLSVFCVPFCFNEMIFCFQGQDLRLRSGWYCFAMI